MPGRDASGPSDEPATLGQFIAALRRERRRSGTELGRCLGVTQSTVSKIEHGLIKVRRTDLPAIIDFLEASPEQARRMAELADGERSRTERLSTVDPTRRAQLDIAALEARARELRLFQVAVPPGLLHTAGYASAVLADYRRPLDTAVTPGEVPAAVTERMRRQEILADRGKRFWFVVAETALLNRVAPPAVMLSQVERLRSAAAEPNVLIRILRSDTQLVYPPLHDFELLDEKVVIIDTMTTSVLARRRRTSRCIEGSSTTSGSRRPTTSGRSSTAMPGCTPHLARPAGGPPIAADLVAAPVDDHD